MTVRLAINGFGRIGRNIFRAVYEGGYRHDVKIVAINDLGSPSVNAHLLKYDSVHGVFAEQVGVNEQDGEVNDQAARGSIEVAGDHIDVFSQTNTQELPWADLGVDLVLECTGTMTTRELAARHLQAGAARVLISAPAKGVDATVVYGVNHGVLRASDEIVSNASCTTNCLAPIAQLLHQHWGIESGLMTTIHAYTNDQNLTDSYSQDLYRARSATQSMIPTKTGAAATLGLILPELAGRLDGLAVRVPTPNVSLVDLNVVMTTAVDVASVNRMMRDAAQKSTILDYNDSPLVAIDFNHNTASAIFDGSQTRVQGRLLKVMAWYDNEWGFANRMLDTSIAWLKAV